MLVWTVCHALFAQSVGTVHGDSVRHRLAAFGRQRIGLSERLKGVVLARDRVLLFYPTLALHTLSGTSNGFRYVRLSNRFASGSLMHVSVFSSKRMARNAGNDWAWRVHVS